MSKNIKVEIWSDVMCPFCWIGKRKFEMALQNFPYKDQVLVEWRAFQLDPTTKTDPRSNIYEMLAKKKGIAPEQAKVMISNVSRVASSVGLTMNFDRAVIANSYKAHRFSAFAKSHGKGLEAEEALFKAYFTDGQNVDDSSTLLSLGVNLGLDSANLESILSSNSFGDEVNRDIATAHSLGISGVPHFRINNKFTVSGAQDPSQFMQVLQRAYDDWKSNHSDSEASFKGEVCDLEGNCK